MTHALAALIPAYDPSPQLVAFVEELAATDFAAIIVVNDGSGTGCDATFAALEGRHKVVVLRHAVNLGKGAALKTGLNHAYCHFPELLGVVTIDADGQHLITDAVGVGQELVRHPQSLVIGARQFGGRVPLRSLVGNSITKMLFQCLIGQRMTDTQSGLRGIPREFIPVLLQVPSMGYEFELDMLLIGKHAGWRIRESGIQTVYLEGNKSSHFNPFLDSMKIYFAMITNVGWTS